MSKGIEKNINFRLAIIAVMIFYTIVEVFSLFMMYILLGLVATFFGIQAEWYSIVIWILVSSFVASRIQYRQIMYSLREDEIIEKLEKEC